MLHAELLFSKAKWKKVFLLFSEVCLIAAHPVVRLWRKDPSAAHSTDAVERGESTKPVEVCSAFSLDNNVPIPAELFDKCRDYIQDRYDESSGCVDTHFDYQIVVVPNGAIYSNGCTHVSVYDRNNVFCQSLSYQKYNKKTRLNLGLGVTRFIPGKTANLYGSVENTVGNYGHWLLDGVSRLLLITREFSLEEFDHFLVPKLKYDFQMDSLIELGIDPLKLIEIDTLECFRFEQLICSTAPRGYSSTVFPDWMIDGFRDAFLPDNPPETARRRLYISRRDADSRKFTNEEELAGLLERYGFEIIELSDHSFEKKIELFHSAECIVGLIGAGFANLIFCDNSQSNRTKIVELMPDSYVNYLYTSVCTHLKLDYHYIVFDNDSRISKANPYYGNLTLDEAALEDKLKTLGYRSLHGGETPHSPIHPGEAMSKPAS